MSDRGLWLTQGKLSLHVIFRVLNMALGLSHQVNILFLEMERPATAPCYWYWIMPKIWLWDSGKLSLFVAELLNCRLPEVNFGILKESRRVRLVCRVSKSHDDGTGFEEPSASPQAS